MSGARTQWRARGEVLQLQATLLRGFLALLRADESCLCSDPHARSDPIGESEPKPRDACLILFFYLLFYLNFLFKKCRDPNPRPDLNGGSEPEPGLLRRFHLSYQNIYLCHYVLGFSITQKHFQMVDP